MEDEKKPEMNSESSWLNSSYFFDAEQERSILNDFGWNIPPPPPPPPPQQQQPLSLVKPDTTSSMEFDPIELLHQQGSALAGNNSSVTPTTSNRSVSSSSSDEQPERSTGSDAKPPPDNKLSKGRKKGQKRTRQQRFAFMTKSDVDHLEDGYRWRKYGQKAVKNSPYPRSYYRCTNNKCTVKKRVERSCEDPTIVITTYEGQHCHHTVSFPRGGIFSHEVPLISGLNRSASQVFTPASQNPKGGQLGVSQLHQPQHEVRPTQMQRESTTQRHESDQGLLGDIVPPGMRSR